MALLDISSSGEKWTDYAAMHAEQLEKAIREGLADVIEHRAN